MERQVPENENIELQVNEILGEFSIYYDGSFAPEPILLYEENVLRLLRLQQTLGDKVRMTVLRGEKGSGRKLALKHLACKYQTAVLFVDCTIFMRKYAELGLNLTRMLEWKLCKEGCWLCICDREDTEEERALWSQFLTELARDGYSCFITVKEKNAVLVRADCELVEVEFQSPGIWQRAMLWEHYLAGHKTDKEIDPMLLGSRYSLNAGAIRQVLTSAELYRASYGRENLSSSDIAAAVTALSAASMGTYARQVPCVFTWEDLVTDESLTEQLQNLCNQVKYRNIVGERWGFYEKRPYGNGICALFYGPPGTGKTMAAQVVASELGLELYRVDLSQMSSKYIGETQKNISTLFENAKEKNVILFFDEADALFSRRTQVKDANDRHANGEIAHLLQQLEEYEGITILATNLRTQIDDAFKRRIKMMVGFRLPNAETRKRLWRKAVPERAPLDADVNLDFFAEKFEISGSEIKEIVLDAAFLAAAEEKEIGREHICKALKTCYEKYGRVLSEGDF